MNSFGLDLGASTLKIAQLKKEKGEFFLVSAGMIKTPTPGMASEAEKDLVAVAEAVKKLKKDAGIASFEVFSSLPESKVFTRVIELPEMTDEEIGQALHWELEEVVPIPLSEANYDWQVIGKEPSKISVLVAAAPKNLIKKYLRVFELADLRPVGLETEILSLIRAINYQAPEKVKLIVDIGARSVNLIVTKGEEIILTRSLPTAGEAMTRSVSSSLSLDPEMAEEYKRTYGLEENQFEGKIKQAVEPILKLILGEVEKSLDFSVQEKKKQVEMIVLSGGGAILPGLTEMIASRLGIEVIVADPFSKLKCDEKLIAPLRKFAPSFSVVIGLAMRET